MDDINGPVPIAIVLPYIWDVNELWKQQLETAQLDNPDLIADRLDRYLDLLLEANQKMNLTRIADRAAAEIQHVADALTLLPFICPVGQRLPIGLADVGSGGGVPGLPIACTLWPDATMTLIESTKKKASFLRSAADQLELSNVTVLDDRAEIIGHSTRRESFDVVIARAVGSLDWLVEWCLPLVKVGGKLLAMKGARITEELPAAAKAIHILGGASPIVHPVALPGTEHHVIVEIKKIGKSDRRYPRDPTTTKGKPMT